MSTTSQLNKYSEEKKVKENLEPPSYRRKPLTDFPNTDTICKEVH